jgi:hypothetical protein
MRQWLPQVEGHSKMVQAFRTASLNGDLEEVEAAFRAAIDAKLTEQCSSGYDDFVAFAESNDLLVEDALQFAKVTIEEEGQLTPSYLMFSLVAGCAVRLSGDGLADETNVEQARSLLPLLDLMNSVPIGVYTLVSEIWFADRSSGDLRRGVKPSKCLDREEGLVVVIARPDTTEYRQYRTIRQDDGVIFEFVGLSTSQRSQLILLSLFELLPRTCELKAIVSGEEGRGPEGQ